MRLGVGHGELRVHGSSTSKSASTASATACRYRLDDLERIALGLDVIDGAVG